MVQLCPDFCPNSGERDFSQCLTFLTSARFQLARRVSKITSSDNVVTIKHASGFVTADARGGALGDHRRLLRACQYRVTISLTLRSASRPFGRAEVRRALLNRRSDARDGCIPHQHSCEEHIFVFPIRSSSFSHERYGLTPSFRTCSVKSRTTCPNLGPSAAETHSRRKRSSSIPKSASISLIASARFSVL